MNTLQLNDKYASDIESYMADEDAGIDRSASVLSTRSTTASVIFPEWMSKCKVTGLAVIIIAATALTIFLALYPFMYEKEQDPLLQCDSGSCPKLKARTGLRSVVTLFHSLINATVVLAPFFIWYFKNSCKVQGFSQKDLPLSQRTLFYSYSINTGWGQQISALGVAVSNILYALIIMFRFEYFRMISEKADDSKTIDIRGPAIAMLFIGMSVRVFASMVPSLPVDKNKILHYSSAGMLFLASAIYMVIEAVFIDGCYGFIDIKMKGADVTPVFRRILCGFYIFWFIGMCVFMKMKLWAFSSIAELSALLCQELYFLTYISGFRFLDGDDPYLDWNTP